MTNYGKTKVKDIPVLISDKSIFCEGGGRLLSDIIYPIGSIYMSVNNVNPTNFFGGTWEQIKDRFLIGAGNLYNGGATGGEKYHTLTPDEIPNSVPQTRIALAGEWSLGAWGNHNPNTTAWTSNLPGQNGEGTHGKSHNNMPPYLAVYMWKRIS